MTRRPTFGSLCAGIGGADLGFAATGFEIAWQVERDLFKRQILAVRFPTVMRVATLEDLDLALRCAVPVPDLIYAELQSIEVASPALAWILALRPGRAIVVAASSYAHDPAAYTAVDDALRTAGYAVATASIGYATVAEHVASVGRSMRIVVGERGASTRSIGRYDGAFLAFGGDGAQEPAAGMLDERGCDVELLESVRGFPSRWSCVCGAGRCTCGPARRVAIREATAPAFAAWCAEAVA